MPISVVLSVKEAMAAYGISRPKAEDLVGRQRSVAAANADLFRSTIDLAEPSLASTASAFAADDYASGDKLFADRVAYEFVHGASWQADQAEESGEFYTIKGDVVHESHVLGDVVAFEYAGRPEFWRLHDAFVAGAAWQRGRETPEAES